MQTFLPHNSFSWSLDCLDNKRLGKQRVEAMQILKALKQGPKIAYKIEPIKCRKVKVLKWGLPLDQGDGVAHTPWYNHPCTKMWKDYEAALERYMNISIIKWKSRGFKNTMELSFKYHKLWEKVEYPPWFTEEFCAAHRSNLLRKDKEYYSKFGWTEPDNLPYIWPV